MKNENCPTWSPEASSDFLRSPTPNQTLQIGDPNSISQRSNTWFNQVVKENEWGFATTAFDSSRKLQQKTPL